MKQKKMWLLLLAHSFLYPMESKIEGEVTFGIDSSFGVDGLESVIGFIPPLVDTIRPMRYADYKKAYVNENVKYRNAALMPSSYVYESAQNLSAQPQRLRYEPSYYHTYKPKYSGTTRDLELTAKYLSKNIELRKKLSVRLKENYSGLGIKVDIFGKKITHSKFLDDNEIDKLKISVISDNKYINGEINYYVKSESTKKKDIDKIDNEKELKNKVVDYTFSVNPIPDSKVSLSLDFSGQNKEITIGPTLRYRNGGTYINTSILFNNIKSAYDLTDELDKIKHIAPGYDKIEYFKRWTLKDKYKSNPQMLDIKEYEEERADLEKAEVSGTKGTSRILGYYSGSLYGDSPIRYIAKNLFNEIYDNGKFGGLSSLIKKFEKDGYITVLDFLRWDSLRLPNITEEIKNKEEMNKIINKLGKDLYKKIGIEADREYSSVGLWTQVPSEFVNLLPGYYPYFDFRDINPDKLSPDYLYNNGIRNTIVPYEFMYNRSSVKSSSSEGDVSEKYIREERTHYFDSDFQRYVIDGVANGYKLNKFSEFPSGAWNIVKDSFAYLFQRQGKINDIINLLPDFQEAIRNPYEIKGLDMLRGFYSHKSEKQSNVDKYGDYLKESFKDIDLKNNKSKHSIKIKIDAGHLGQNYKIGTTLLLNDKIEVSSDKYEYVKKANHFSVEMMYRGLLEFSNKSELTLAKNDLLKKESQEKYIYDTISLKTDTYLGLNIPTTKRFNLLLGIRHIGNFGWIDPKSIIDKDGKEVKWTNIAKRDKDNNPIGKDGSSIITSETTEKVLVDKEYERLKNEGKNKLKRNIHQSDYIETIESNAVKSIYDSYNIFSPRITMVYRPYENVVFTNHLELPISFKKFMPAGIKSIYTGEIKYLIDDSFKEQIFTKGNLIKFRSMGKFETGLLLGKSVEKYLSYKAMADISFLRGDIKGNDKGVDFSLSLNPLIVNFPIKPRFIISKEKTENFVKFGLEYSKGTEFSSLVGFKKVIKSTRDILEKELKPDILDIIKNRGSGGDEFNNARYALTRISFNEKIDYTLTPFIEIKKEEGKFRISVKADSLKASAHIEKDKTKEEKTIEKPTSDYFAWNYQKSSDNWFWRLFMTKEYNYFKEVETEKIIKMNQKIIDLDSKKYNLEIDTEYIQDNGINFGLHLDLKYAENKLVEMSRDDKRIENTSKIVSLTTSSHHPNFTDEIKNNPDNQVEIKDGNVLQSLKDFVKKKNAHNDVIYDSYKPWMVINHREMTDYLLKERLDYPGIIKEEVNIKESKFLHTKKINVNLSTYLGYSLNPISNLVLSFGMKHKLVTDYEAASKIVLDDVELFGSRNILFKNTISPEIKIGYNLIKSLKFSLNAAVPVHFEDKDYIGFKVEIKTGFEW